MTWPTALVLAAALSLGACSYGDAEGTPAAGPTFPFATVLLDDGEETTLVTVEVAETPEQHRVGLSGRDSLPEDRGMVFVFFEERETGVRMKETTIPLSIAFFDAEGEILEIQDMDPCEGAPCPLYEPGEPYMGALEVNQGAFEAWGIEEGDTVRLTR